MAEASKGVPQQSVPSTDSLEESDVDVGSEDEWSIFDSSDPYSETDDDTEDSTDDEDYGSNTFVQKLRAWAISTNQRRFALNSLLALLRKETNLKVPKNARTLLKVPPKTST